MKGLFATACLLLVVLASFTSSAKAAKCPGACTFIYYPVCASNGKSYANECVFRAETCRSDHDVHIVHKGNCSKRQVFDTSANVRRQNNCPQACTFIYDPVCASNGKTYANKCVFRFENCSNGVEIVHKGSCS